MTDDDIARQIQEARRILAQLNFDAERSNERSALVLLALLGLTPGTAWADATSPRLRTVEIMAWLRAHYGKDYKPNTRETIRRFTLHQFAAALLVAQNPDKPDRPVNSPQWCYQVHPRALSLLRGAGDAAFQQDLLGYLAEVPGLRDTYAKARDLRRIPVTLPDSSAVTLSPGGQNVLLKQMIEGFCGYFTPGGQVLYVGDADTKWAVFEHDALAALGVTVDRHGKMPDLVVYMPDKNWLVLMEAASSHGPVDATRHGELAALFGSSTADLVYVSCFPSREDMRGYLPQIAWETEVWCADHPTHLIHFNGERFLGPYDQE
ncbi:MAG TPA: BsuBI/PstI family type II restriction endonuclease [Streptosporangiaceae bacterium]|nr:BsuBI/PstI family type II restriction endonuclease [Streptosporangiaceae bacterium]